MGSSSLAAASLRLRCLASPCSPSMMALAWLAMLCSDCVGVGGRRGYREFQDGQALMIPQNCMYFAGGGIERAVGGPSGQGRENHPVCVPTSLPGAVNGRWPPPATPPPASTAAFPLAGPRGGGGSRPTPRPEDSTAATAQAASRALRFRSSLSSASTSRILGEEMKGGGVTPRIQGDGEGWVAGR